MIDTTAAIYDARVWSDHCLIEETYEVQSGSSIDKERLSTVHHTTSFVPRGTLFRCEVKHNLPCGFSGFQAPPAGDR